MTIFPFKRWQPDWKFEINKVEPAGTLPRCKHGVYLPTTDPQPGIVSSNCFLCRYTNHFYIIEKPNETPDKSTIAKS